MLIRFDLVENITVLLIMLSSILKIIILFSFSYKLFVYEWQYFRTTRLRGHYTLGNNSIKIFFWFPVNRWRHSAFPTFLRNYILIPPHPLVERFSMTNGLFNFVQSCYNAVNEIMSVACHKEWWLSLLLYNSSTYHDSWTFTQIMWKKARPFGSCYRIKYFSFVWI